MSGRRGLDWIREQLDAGRVAQITAALKPHRDRSEAVAACIRNCEANMDRMYCDLCGQRGLPVGSGIVESACNISSGIGPKSRGAAG